MCIVGLVMACHVTIHVSRPSLWMDRDVVAWMTDIAILSICLLDLLTFGICLLGPWTKKTFEAPCCTQRMDARQAERHLCA